MFFVETKKYSRIWELDFIRGLALLLMVCFHLMYDLKNFGGFNVDYHSGVTFGIGCVAGILFVVIAGVTSSLGHNNFKRGLELLAWATLLTVVTYFIDPNNYIKFGILHLLGLSKVLYALLQRVHRGLVLILGISLIIAFWGVSQITMVHNWFFVFGLKSANFVSLDYYPLIPWFGLFLLGAVGGQYFYKMKQSLFGWQMQSNLVLWIGKYTLPIYLLHQPVLVAVVWGIKNLVGGLIGSNV